MASPRTGTARTATVLGAAGTRLAFAAWFLARPQALGKALDVDPNGAARTLARVVAVRELVLGTGTVAALATGRPTAGWLRAMAAADAVNGSVTLVAGLTGRVPLRRALGLAAFDASGTAWELYEARRLDLP